MMGDNTRFSLLSLYPVVDRGVMMSKPGGKTYRPWNPEHYQQGAYRPSDKLPAGDLVFFLLDTVPRLDLSRFYTPSEQETRGSPPYDPAMMSCLLIYAYYVGVFSSRKIALACERNLAFLAIVGQERPDFAPSAISASCLWRRSRTSLSMSSVWQARWGWCAWATSPPMARRFRAMRHGTRR
jgi:transposase